jgi:ankyrin repeat protein
VDNPIFLAIERDDVQSVRQLLAAVPQLGSAVNAQQPDTDLWDPENKHIAPLHLAATHGRVEIATLLNQGASVDPLDIGGDIPLTVAIAKQHLAVVQPLLARGARACHRNQSGENVFQAALAMRMEEDTDFQPNLALDAHIGQLCSPCPHCVRAEARARGR